MCVLLYDVQNENTFIDLKNVYTARAILNYLLLCADIMEATATIFIISKMVV